jgi:hypothetical protein
VIAPRKTALRSGRSFLALAGALLCLAALFAAPAGARQLEVENFLAPGLTPNLSPSTVPGARPYELIDTFSLNQTTTLEGITAAPANLRDLSFELPPGFVANVAGFPRCSAEAFAASACATAAQVGVANLLLSAGLGTLTVPVFNLAPPSGRPAQFGFRAVGSGVHIDFQLRAGSDYGVTASVNGLSEAAGVLSSTVRIWGVPGDPGHDAQRYTGAGTSAAGPYPEAPPFRPLLSNPTSCNGPLITTMAASTWQHPGETISAAPFEAPGGAGCNQLDFGPEIEAKPTTDLADSPSGLDFHLHIPQIQDPEGSASAQLRSARITLPAGLAVNPAAANGLGTCSEQQIGLVDSADERQLLRYDLPPINFSGSFTVANGAQSTAPISATASSAQVAAAIETLPGLAGNVRVGGARGGWIVTFVGALAGTGVPLLTGTVTDSPSQTVAVTGTGGSFELEHGGVATAPLPFDASAEEIQAALSAIPALGLGNLYPGNVFVNSLGTEEGTTSFQVIFGGDLTATEPLLSAGSSLTGPGAGVTVTPVAPPPPRALSTAAFADDAPGTLQFSSAPAACPDSAKIGTVRIDSPALLGHPLSGNVYLASPGANPFGSLLAIYIAVADPASGIVLKLPGRVEADPQTGRLVLTVSEAPQLPFEDLRLELFKGTSAPLRTGVACGTYTVETQLTPWSAPEAAVRRPKDSFTISGGAGAGACAGSEASAPDSSTFEAGTVDPSAGAYSPFTLSLSRPDGARRLSAIDTTLPAGLLAKLAGVSSCPDAALALAAAHSGAQEQASPSCPAASRVGSLAIAAGAGPAPYNLSGAAYLAGPYKGAPLSLAVIAPALAGPFDLGTVVVRVALYVDPQTTRVRAVSDPLPATLQGIPLDLRSFALNLDAPAFTRNPTSCSALAFNGAGPAQSAHFQVGDCGTLAFKPKLELALAGATKPRARPALKATLSFPGKGNSANLATASLTLPKSLRLVKSRLGALCGQAQFAAHSCPPASVLGSAKATTPLLAAPLQGPVYLGSNGPKQPPELLADLGGAVHVVLAGRLGATKAGAVRAGFEALPDAPLSKFVLSIDGGKKGLLENAADLCARTNRVAVVLDGQNAASSEGSLAVADGCKKAGKGKAKGTSKGKAKRGGGAAR